MKTGLLGYTFLNTYASLPDQEGRDAFARHVIRFLVDGTVPPDSEVPPMLWGAIVRELSGKHVVSKEELHEIRSRSGRAGAAAKWGDGKISDSPTKTTRQSGENGKNGKMAKMANLPHNNISCVCIGNTGSNPSSPSMPLRAGAGAGDAQAAPGLDDGRTAMPGIEDDRCPLTIELYRKAKKDLMLTQKDFEEWAAYYGAMGWHFKPQSFHAMNAHDAYQSLVNWKSSKAVFQARDASRSRNRPAGGITSLHDPVGAAKTAAAVGLS